MQQDLSGGDVNFNPRLRSAVTAAKEQSMPAENITRAIKRGTGELEGVNYEEIRYEGYGISGVAIIIDCLTDNKVRAVADVRHALSKNGGNLVLMDLFHFYLNIVAVSFLLLLDDSEKLMDEAINLGADDVIVNDDKSIEIITSPNDFLK